MKWWIRGALSILTVLGVATLLAAQPRTLDGVAIDPDAELVVALADDTNNMRG